MSGQLQVVKAGVESAAREQILVLSFFDDPASLEDQDPIGGADGAQAMGDHERGPSSQ